MKFSMFNFKGCDLCHGLVSKAEFLLIKQSYDNLRLHW